MTLGKTYEFSLRALGVEVARISKKKTLRGL